MTATKHRSKQPASESIGVEREIVVGGGKWTSTSATDDLHITLYGNASGAHTVVDHVRKTAGRLRLPDRKRDIGPTQIEWYRSSETTDTPLGPARTVQGTLRIGRDRVPFRMVVAAEETIRIDPTLVMAALLPQPFWQPDVRDALRELKGIPARWEFFTDGEESTATMLVELVAVDSVPSGSGWADPPRYAHAAGHSQSSLRDVRPPRRRPPHEDDDSRPVRMPRAPIDAGFAFGPDFFAKLAAVASAGARVVLPFEDRPLRFDLDWFAEYRSALLDASWVEEILDRDFAFMVGMLIEDLVAQANDIDDLAQVTALLTEDEIDELASLLETEEGGERWQNFATSERRDAIALNYLTVVLAPPMDVNLEPDADFSEDLEDTLIEGATATYDRDTGEVQLRDVLGVMHIHLSKLRFILRMRDPAAQAADVTTDGAETRVRIDFFQLKFDFWTEPSADIWMILVRIVTLGLTDAMLWNAGVGDASLGSSEVVGNVVPERVGDRLRTRWRSAGGLSQVDTNLFIVGWNPLQDLVTLAGSLVVSLFDLIAGMAVLRVETAINTRLDDERILEFPRSFTCGSDIISGRQGADAATRVLAQPTRVDRVLTPQESIYYRGTYGRMPRGTTDPAPFNPRMPRDGAYVVHRRVFDRMIERRTALAGVRLTPDIPAPSGRQNGDLFPALVHNIQRIDATTLGQLREAGLLSPTERQQWVSAFEYLRVFSGLSESPIFDEFEDLSVPVTDIIGIPRVYLTVRSEVTWTDGLNGVPFGSPVADAVITVTGQHVMDLDFMTAGGESLRELVAGFLTSLEGLTLPLLPGGQQAEIRTPFRFGSVPILDAPINRKLKLRVGLWEQRLAALPGIPAAFEFSLTDLAAVADGGVTYHTDVQEFRDQSRVDLVKTATVQRAEQSLTNLQRTLQDIAHYVAYYDVVTRIPAGADWSVVRDGRATDQRVLTVRTEGDRLYLDFDLVPLILADLAFWDLQVP